MNFSGISDKSLLGKILRIPFRFIPPETKATILQGKLKGKKWIVGTGTHGCWLGSYEFDKRLMFEKIITKESIVFDIGAHVGFYTLLASILVGPNGRVFAFEPVSSNLFYLREHLRLNHVANVTVIEAAVSDKCGMVSFDEGPTSSMGHIAQHGKLQVKTVTLDELVLSRQIPAPNYVKLDIEGAEMLALTGAKSMLVDSRPTLFLATHGNDVHQECCRFLEALGYQLQPIDGENLEQSSEVMAFHK